MTAVLGLCGVGAMGTAVGWRLTANGVAVVAAGEGRSSATKARMQRAGIADVGTLDRVVAESDVVLSIMGSVDARQAARDFIAAVRRSPKADLTYIECNLIAPEDVIAIAVELSALHVNVVDAGIVGPPPTLESSPCFYVAGPKLDALQQLRDVGFDIREVGRDIGAASALKVCSAAVWQGCLALMTEVMVTAHHYGLADQLTDDLRQHQRLLSEWFGPALTEAPPRARRWTADMAVISRTMSEASASGNYHEAAGALYARMAAAMPPVMALPSQVIDALC